MAEDAMLSEEYSPFDILFISNMDNLLKKKPHRTVSHKNADGRLTEKKGRRV